MKYNVKRNTLFAATTVTAVVYLSWRGIFTLPFDYGILAMVLGVLLLISELFSGFESVEQYLNMVNMTEPEMPVIPDSWYPHVDILIMTHNEDVSLVYKTANACRYLEYPDKSKVHVYICDDTDRAEMKKMAQDLGVGYFGFSGNKHAKAGNINNALAHCDSPLVATFDADMIPRSVFLMQTVPYFFLPVLKKDENGVWVQREKSKIDPQKVGFVQAPQGFYNPDLFQFNLFSETRVPNEQDYFFREINVGRNRSNSALFVGSNAVFSREALDDVGGMAINTITEDFETGLRIQAQKYRTYAISTPLAHGLAPHSIADLMKQRERWARGCIQSLRNVRPFFCRNLSLAAKKSSFACLVYWWTFTRRFIFITVPIVSVLFNVHVLECTLPQILLFWLPYYILTNKTLSVLSGHTRNQHWNNLIDTIMFPYLVLPIILETLHISQKRFIVTSKRKGAKPPVKPLLLAMPHIMILGTSLLALGLCIVEAIETSAFYNMILIFWLTVNSKNLFFAVCFMLGRENVRRADRFFTQLPLVVEYQGRKYAGHTTDISETGLAAMIGFPIYLPDNQDVKLEVKSDKYQAQLNCQVVHVEQPKKEGERWRYSFYITNIAPKERSQYMQIVFDRLPTLPRSITTSYTLYDDFKSNIEKRLAPSYEQAARKHPRILLNVRLALEDNSNALVRDFNYKYVSIKFTGNSAPKAFRVEVVPHVIFDLEKEEEFSGSGKGDFLYKLLNIDELLDNEYFMAAVERWVQQMSGVKSRPEPILRAGSDGVFTSESEEAPLLVNSLAQTLIK